MNPQQAQAMRRNALATTDFGGPDNDMDFYWYGVPPFQISSVLTPISNQIQIDASANFLWLAMSYQASIGAAGASAALTESSNVIPLILVQIQDTGSQKNLSNIPIPLTTFAGDGKRPYRLIKPRLFMKNATIAFLWTNFVAAGTEYGVRVVLHGYKVYD